MKQLTTLFFLFCLFKLSVIHAEFDKPEIYEEVEKFESSVEIIPWDHVPEESWPGENWPEEIIDEETLTIEDTSEQTTDEYNVKIEINANENYRQPNNYYSRRRYQHYPHKDHSSDKQIDNRGSQPSRGALSNRRWMSTN